MSARWSVTVSPVKLANPSHPVSAYNTGQLPLALHVSTAERVKVHGVCTIVPVHPKWASLSATSMNLRPGHHGSVKVSVAHMPAKPVDLAVVFHTEHPGNQNVAVAENVAAQVGVGVSPPCLSLPVQASSPLPWLIIAVFAVVILAALGAAWRYFYRGSGTHRAAR